MNEFKQYAYLIATFIMLVILGLILLSLQCCEK